jgi:uncharacterized membrane protein
MAKELFTDEQRKLIEDSIREAELATSGEIQVHIEYTCKIDPLDRAAQVFKTLKMHRTKLRNGVLFYLAYEDHKFAILGDAGINSRVPKGYWDEIKDIMLPMFKNGDFAGGLSKGVLMAGQQLKAHFQYKYGDINELPDGISFGSQ